MAFVALSALAMGAAVLVSVALPDPSTKLGVIVDHRPAFYQSQIAGAITFANPAVRTFVHGGGRPERLAALASAQSQVIVFCVAPLTLVLRPQK
jgi:hypothetical protein